MGITLLIVFKTYFIFITKIKIKNIFIIYTKILIRKMTRKVVLILFNLE